MLRAFCSLQATPTQTTSIPNMRKIEREMCDAIANEQDWQKANTKVTNFYNDDKELVVTSVFLHNNLIAEVTDTTVTIFDGGWRTNTTKSRLNAICTRFGFEGEGVIQKDWVWYIRKFMGQAGTSKVFNTYEFTNGYTFG